MLCLCFNHFRQELTRELNHQLEQHPVGSAFRLEDLRIAVEEEQVVLYVEALHINYAKVAGLFGDRVPFALRPMLALGGAAAEPVLLPMLLTPERKEQLRGVLEDTLNKRGLQVEVAAVEVASAVRQPMQPAPEESEDTALRLPPQLEEALLDALVRYLQKREQPQPAKPMATLRRDWFKLFSMEKDKVAEIRFCEMDEDTPACAIDLSEEQNGGCMGWVSGQEDGKCIVIIACENGRVYAPQDSSNLFAFFSSAEKIDVSRLDTSKVTNMSRMFACCYYALESLDVSGWDTSKVTDMSGMFTGCYALESLDVSRWNTSKVTDMRGMFTDCHLLEIPDVSRWNTSKVTNMSGMFSSCHVLQSLDVSRWNTSKVTDMSWMFKSCEALQSLDVSGWDTSRVKDMDEMFKGCPARRPAWHHE